MRLFILMGAALLAAPATAQAPQAMVAERADPATMEAARALLRNSGFEAQMAESARKNAEATFNTMVAAAERQHGVEMPSDLRGRIMGIVLESVDAMVVELRRTALNDAAAVYARHFTAEELRELDRLQREPVMVKFHRIAPGFMTELMQIGMAVAAERMPALQATLAKEIADWQAAEALRREPARS